MSLVCLSFSHQNTPIAFRERVYFDSDSIANACARFRCGTDQPSQLRELVIVSTCNRTEFYVDTSEEIPGADSPLVAEIRKFILDARDVELAEIEQYGRWSFGPEVAIHLSRVASGLESLVLGEPQILGQVGDSMRLGIAMNSAGVVLTRLFQTAIRAGRRARLETQINERSLNISTVAVNTVEREMENLEGKTVTMLGAGEMADLALEQLRKRGVTKVQIVNRTIERANELATRYSGDSYVFEQITSVLSETDVLISSTGAPHTLITREMVAMIMRKRPERKLAILDIAVPRDVDPTVEEIQSVFRCDIDDLHISTDHAARMRESQVPQVQTIIMEEVNSFLTWVRGLGVDSIVAGLHRKAESIRDQELARLSQLIPDLSDDQKSMIDRFSKSLVRKLLHDPIVQLRKSQSSREGVAHADAVSQLFRLEPNSLPEPSTAAQNQAPSNPTSQAKV